MRVQSSKLDEIFRVVEDPTSVSPLFKNNRANERGGTRMRRFVPTICCLLRTGISETLAVRGMSGLRADSGVSWKVFERPSSHDVLSCKASGLVP